GITNLKIKIAPFPCVPKATQPSLSSRNTRVSPKRVERVFRSSYHRISSAVHRGGRNSRFSSLRCRNHPRNTETAIHLQTVGKLDL
ncbi:hypothetical protein U1Q18_040700, partial [Sarracenia purpurea var. burkii]